MIRTHEMKYFIIHKYHHTYCRCLWNRWQICHRNRFTCRCCNWQWFFSRLCWLNEEIFAWSIFNNLKVEKSNNWKYQSPAKWRLSKRMNAKILAICAMTYEIQTQHCYYSMVFDGIGYVSGSFSLIICF